MASRKKSTVDTTVEEQKPVDLTNVAPAVTYSAAEFSDPDSYLAVINSLRAMFGAASGDMVMVDGGRTDKLIVMQINYGERADEHLKLVLQMKDLYVIGFKGKTKWFELQEKGINQIVGSEPLGKMTPSYGSLDNWGNTKKTVVGAGLLERSLKYLSTMQEKKKKKMSEEEFVLIANYMKMFALLISESMRFPDISLYIARNIEGSGSVPEWIHTLINNWDVLSSLARDHVRSEVGVEIQTLAERKNKISVKNENGEIRVIKTVGDVRGVLGMLPFIPEVRSRRFGL